MWLDVWESCMHGGRTAGVLGTWGDAWGRRLTPQRGGGKSLCGAFKGWAH